MKKLKSSAVMYRLSLIMMQSRHPDGGGRSARSFATCADEAVAATAAETAAFCGDEVTLEVP